LVTQLTPFACLFPDLDTYLFDFVVITGMPLFVVSVCFGTAMALRAYARRQEVRGSSPETSLSLSDFALDVCFFITFLVFPACSASSFKFFAVLEFTQPGEDGYVVMRADKSVGINEDAYLAVRSYAMIMVALYPLGIPLLFTYLLWCSRDDLRELQRLERVQETRLEIAKLQAESAATPEQTTEMVQKAEEAYEASVSVYTELRDELPATVRRLTSGYELRTYWFEVSPQGLDPAPFPCILLRRAVRPRLPVVIVV
jgi:hypothetical protein